MVYYKKYRCTQSFITLFWETQEKLQNCNYCKSCNRENNLRITLCALISSWLGFKRWAKDWSKARQFRVAEWVPRVATLEVYDSLKNPDSACVRHTFLGGIIVAEKRGVFALLLLPAGFLPLRTFTLSLAAYLYTSSTRHVRKPLRNEKRRAVCGRDVMRGGVGESGYDHRARDLGTL